MKNFILFNLIIGIISCSNIISSDTHFKELQNVKTQLTCLSTIKAAIDEEDHSWADPFYTVEDLHESLERKSDTDKNVQISKLFLKHLEKDQFFYDLFKYVCPYFFTHREKQYNCDWDKFNHKNDELEKRVKEEVMVFLEKKRNDEKQKNRAELKKKSADIKERCNKECRKTAVYLYQNQIALEFSLQNEFFFTEQSLDGQSDKVSELRQHKKVTFKMSDRSLDFDESA